MSRKMASCATGSEVHTNHTPGATIGIDRKWLVLAAVGAGTFMSALDGSVVNTILPVIRTYFASDIAGVEWAVVIYLLVVSGILSFL